MHVCCFPSKFHSVTDSRECSRCENEVVEHLKRRVENVLDQQQVYGQQQHASRYMDNYACKDSEQRLPGVRNAVHSPPDVPPCGQKTCFVLSVLSRHHTQCHAPLVFTLFTHFIGIQLKIFRGWNSVDWKTFCVPFVLCRLLVYPLLYYV